MKKSPGSWRLNEQGAVHFGMGEKAMMMTLILSAAGCILLFLCIWGVTVTMPTGLLVKNFPEDVQESLRPRIESLPMSPKRILGWGILILLQAGYIGLFIIGGMAGVPYQDYTIDLALHRPDGFEYDFWKDICSISIVDPKNTPGLIHLPHRWEIN